MLQRFTGLLELLAILEIAYALSSNRKAIQWRVVVWGGSLQFAFALLVLQTTVGRTTFGWLGERIKKLLSFGQYNSSFVFGELGTPGNTVDSFAFQVLPTIIFASSLACSGFLGTWPRRWPGSWACPGRTVRR